MDAIEAPMMGIGLGHNEAPLDELLFEESADLRARRDELIASAERAPATIEDEEVCGKTADLVRLMSACIKGAEAARVSRKEPFLASGRLVDAHYKRITDPLDKTKRTVETRITVFQRAKAEAERRAREAEARRQAEEADRQRREAEAAAADAQEEADLIDAIAAEDAARQAEADAAAAHKAALVKPAELSRSRGDYGAVASLRTFWDFAELDRAVIDLEALRPHLPLDAVEKAVRAFVRAGGRELRGVKDLSRTLRARCAEMPNDTGAVARKPTAFELELADYEPQLVAALPGHISVDRFKRTVVTAINQNPDLARADRRSLFTACVRAAQDGLLPDGRDAALVVYNTKNKKTGDWDKLCQYMPMVQGIIRRMRNSGELASIAAYVVHEKDEFIYQLGDDPKIVHNPALLDHGKPIGVYAIARLTNGEVQREVMSIAEVEKVRAVSRSKDKGPWVDWWEEMARKTVIRRLSKRLPNSSDIDEMMRREDEQYFTGEDRGEARVGVARPTRTAYGVGPIIDQPETEREEDQADLYPLTTLDGEEVLIEDANEAGDELRKMIEEAHKRSGQDGVHGAWESNATLISLLREKGHNKLADELNTFSAEWLDKRGKDATADAEQPADRDDAWWSADELLIRSTGKDFLAEMHQRCREARTASEVECLRDHNGSTIDALPKADKEQVLGWLIDREKAVAA